MNTYHMAGLICFLPSHRCLQLEETAHKCKTYSGKFNWVLVLIPPLPNPYNPLALP